jgi:hypothetical protein
MRYPEQRIHEITGINDPKKLAMVEHYMRDMYFYPRMLNAVGYDEFTQGACVSVKELDALSWNFV